MSYSERLLEHGNFLTRLAHGGRYRRTVEMASDLRGVQALDFGCGDGVLLRRAYDRGIVRGGYGIDADPTMRESAAKTFEGIEGFQFVDPQSATATVAAGSCDLAICTETLEHVPNPERVLDLICRCCRPEARVIISAPIEVGPSLVGKQLGRYLAGLRRPYGYEPYTMRELLSAAALWDVRAFPSSHTDRDATMTGHKGFDYRELDGWIRKRMRVERVVFSPLPLTGALLNSTVMWRCQTSGGA